MKCPHCNREHPSDFHFCPNTGKKINELKACTNPQCFEFGKHVLPWDSNYCPNCGSKLERHEEVYGYVDEWQGNIRSSRDNETIIEIIKKRELSRIIYSLMSAANIV